MIVCVSLTLPVADASADHSSSDLHTVSSSQMILTLRCVPPKPQAVGASDEITRIREPPSSRRSVPRLDTSDPTGGLRSQ